MRVVRACVVVAVFVSMVIARSVDAFPGTATLVGTAHPVYELCDPECGAELPYMYLGQLDYVAQEPSANTVTFDYVEANRQSFCMGFGPGACAAPASQDEFLFTDDVNNTIFASGLCANAGPTVGECVTPYRERSLRIYPPNAIQMLPVNVSLGDKNDEFAAVIDLTGQEFAFNIQMGAGADKVVLVDNTLNELDGVDQISCGSGIDRVVTTTETIVAGDCESIVRLT